MKNTRLIPLLLVALTLCACKKKEEEKPKDEPSPTNTAPTAPLFSTAPVDGETGVEQTLTITWTASMDSDGDAVKYDFYLGETEAGMTSVSEGQTDVSYSLTDLGLGNTYFIKVTATDGTNDPVSSETRQFTVKNTGSFTDSRDGIEYGIKRIGDQIWMTQNLQYDGSGSYSYDDNAANDATYGRLYEWSAVDAVIPDGWHLPTDEEWKELETTLGMSAADLEVNGYGINRGTDQGTQLKIGGSSGMEFPMAGFRSGGSYSALDNRTYLWVNTTVGGSIFRRRLENATPYVFRFTNPAGDFAISIRLVKD